MPAAGGWSLLLDIRALGHDGASASARLLERGRIAATPMTHWGEVNGDRLVRFVFSNEPVERLTGMGEQVRRSLVGRAPARRRPHGPAARAYGRARLLVERGVMDRARRY